MRVVVNPDEACRKELCRRPSTSNPVIGERVRAIIERVRDGGDEALLGLAEEIDGYRPEYLELGEEQFLEGAFGEEYADYKKRVRRYL